MFYLQLQSQADRLSKQNLEMRRKMSVTQRLAQNAIEDKAELQALLHESERQFSSLRSKVKRQDSSEGQPGSPVSKNI